MCLCVCVELYTRGILSGNCMQFDLVGVPIQGGPEKNGMGYIILPTVCGCNNWYQCMR